MSTAPELDELPTGLAARLRALSLDDRLIAAVLARRHDVHPMVTNRRFWVLTRFVEHLSAIGEDFHDPTSAGVESWIATESKRCHSVCYLRRVYAIARDDGLVDRNPMLGVPSPSGGRTGD